MSYVSDGFFAFPPSFPHQQRILQFSLALFVSCDKILSKTERYDNTMRKTALPTDRLSETARQKLSMFEAWLLRNGKSYQTIRSYLYTARHFLSLYPEITHDNLMLYKCYLIDRYKPNTVNLRIRAMNCFMEFLELPDSRVLMVRLQQKPFLENVISQADYEYLKKCLLRDGKPTYYFAVRIGGLLNQITKRANTTGNLYPEDIREIKEIMEKIWHTHASMLSKQPLTAR